MNRWILILCAFALLLAGCQSAAAPTASSQEEVPASVQTQLVTRPPTSTATPTLTPSATPSFTLTPTITPTFDRLHLRTATPAPAEICPSFSSNPEPAPAIEPPIDFTETEGYLLEYLNAYGPQEMIDQMPEPDRSRYLIFRDLTNDGVPEFVVQGGWPGILFFGCRDGTYVTLLLVFPDGGTVAGHVVSIGDSNRNGIPDLLVLSGVGLHETYHRLIEWDGDRFSDLVVSTVISGMNEGIVVATGHCGKVTLQDVDGDGFQELVVFNPVPPMKCHQSISNGTLPWRDQTDYYRWDGYHYILYRTEYGPAIYRFQAVQDADRLMLNADYDRALGLYQAAITNPDLDWWSEERQDYLQNEWNMAGYPDRTAPPAPAMDPDEYPSLAAYAYYRIMLLHILEKEPDQASDVYQLLQTQYHSTQPGQAYAELATAFWDRYWATQDIGAACQAAIVYAEGHPNELLAYLGNTESPLTPSFYHGWQSLTYEPEDICPFK